MDGVEMVFNWFYEEFFNRGNRMVYISGDEDTEATIKSAASFFMNAYNGIQFYTINSRKELNQIQYEITFN